MNLPATGFDKDHFQTVFESGVFTLNANGTAVYTSAVETLNGYWNAFQLL